MSSAPSSDFATRLERVYEHNEGAMTLPNQTHALLMRAQGDYFLLQAWIGDLVAREMTNAPRTLDKLEELTPAIAKVVKLGNVIAQFDKVIAGYGSEEEVPNPQPHWAELPPPETQSAGGRN